MEDIRKEINTDIVNEPDRIYQIIKSAYSGEEAVLLRSDNYPKITMRARITDVVDLNGVNTIILDGISDKALTLLKKINFAHIEFAGLVSRVKFKSKILHDFLEPEKISSTPDLSDVKVDDSPISALVTKIEPKPATPSSANDQTRLAISFPTELMSYERRNLPRYGFGSGMRGFLKVDPKRISTDNPAGPIKLWGHHDLETWIQLSDMSEGGVCVLSRFPTILDVFMTGSEDAGDLVLGNGLTLKMGFDVRWTKKIIVNSESHEGKDVSYRVGLEFKDHTDDLKKQVRSTLYRLSTQGSI